MMRFLITGSVLLVLLASCTAQAQLSAPEARSFGMGTAYSARATGYEAPFWNPANLGLSRNPSWSAGMNANAAFSNNALSYGQVTSLYGEYLDTSEKSRLLQDVRSATGGGPASLSFDVGAQGMSASYGRFAAGFGGIGAGNAAVTTDALELLLFGNVGESGEGQDFQFEGTSADLWSLYGGYASWAQPFRFDALAGFGFSAGTTVRYGVARDLMRIRDGGSQLYYDPVLLNVGLEKLQATGGDAGTAWAADIGLAMEFEDRLVAGVSIVNAVQVVNWNTSQFEVTSYDIDANAGQISINSITTTYDELDAASRERVDALLAESELPRQLRLGGLYRFSPHVDLSADYVEVFGNGLRSGWDRTLSAGSEFRPVAWAALRAGLATSFDQAAITGGIGLYGGPLHVDFAAGRWGLGGGDGFVTALSVSYWPGY